MNLLKKLAAGLALSAMLAVAASAQDKPDWLPSPLPKPLGEITIGFSNLGSGVNSYVATYLDTFNAYTKKLGVKTIVLDAQVDPAKQSDQVQDLIAQQADVMIVWPVNGKAIVPALRKAKEAGIPVVITNSQADASAAEYFNTFSGPDNIKQANSAGEMMVEALAGKGNVVVIDGLPGYSVAQEREKGFLDIIKQHPDIKVLDIQPGDWSREKAQSVMEAYLVKYGDKIDGVYSADSDMGVGALAAVKAAIAEGKIKPGKIKFTDCTLFAAAYDEIKAGNYYGSVLQSPVVDAQAAVQAAIQIVEGKELPKQLFFASPSITQKNIADYPRPTF
ncbi:sugar ABC transporter substrate-binding protein [Mesorhizobium australicum]|uniref:Sugar ABC transporter substrate-binding protein n=1 Tax=Mesorhizobium australicum TaxID=536018 RepID=A0ACC6T0K0_9HYPH